MSRTDKDAPYWAHARWVPEHTIRCNAGRDVCNLPTVRQAGGPVKWNFARAVLGGGYSHREQCIWAFEDRRTYQHQCGGVPKWFRDHRWTNPDRVRVRDEGRRAVAEHRATGEVDIIHTVRQHRHGAAWDYY